MESGPQPVGLYINISSRLKELFWQTKWRDAAQDLPLRNPAAGEELQGMGSKRPFTKAPPKPEGSKGPT